MKVAIATVQVPFITGGAEVLANALKDQLLRRGHEVDIVTLPFKWYPPGQILKCMLMARLTDLTDVNGQRIDRVIAMKFPAYYISHPHKALWLMHQHRQAYDFYGTDHSDLWQTPDGRAIAAEVKRWDDEFLPTSNPRYTISQNVANRLKRFNNVNALPLHVPLNRPDAYQPGPYGDYILYPSRFDSVKRQHLLLDAIERTPSGLRAVFTGQTDSEYGRGILRRVESTPLLRERVKILGLVPEQTKLELYSHCAAVYNGVLDEDYGYLTIEGFYAAKPVITHTDSGGPLEFVKHDHNGWVLSPDAAALAECLTSIALRRAPVAEMGANARRSILEANLCWDRVISALLA